MIVASDDTIINIIKTVIDDTKDLIDSLRVTIKTVVSLRHLRSSLMIIIYIRSMLTQHTGQWW
jgi:hypothetical protein